MHWQAAPFPEIKLVRCLVGKVLDVVVDDTMKPWDWAALVPVVEGAGGRVTDWSGRALGLGSPGDVLAVGDPALLDEAVRALAPRGG
jgi:myo-inositol-1(or 4)-monophosphatase